MIPPKVKEIGRLIKIMEIRGAGKIARSAVGALKIAIDKSKGKTPYDIFKDMLESARYLNSTRPTAVSLPNALRYVIKRGRALLKEDLKPDEYKVRLTEICDDFILSSEMAVRKIGEIGSRRIQDGDTILTHCNSSAAIRVITTAHKHGKNIKVYATETRPRYQGRLTARALVASGIDVTLIVDSAARLIMNKIDKVIVGADAISVNGALINKIGTSLIALAANEARTLFFTAAETYKFSPITMLGGLIEIEERDASEVISPSEHEKIGKQLKVYNPAFDVTPAKYIDMIFTEKGAIPPQAAYVILQEEFGWWLKEPGLEDL